MGVLHNRLGISITRHNPLKDSPYLDSFEEGEPYIPPANEFMITEDGKLMVDETTLDLMITE